MAEGRLIRIVNTEPVNPGAVRRWIAAGEPVLIGPSLVMTLCVDRLLDAWGEAYEPVIAIEGPGANWRAHVPAGFGVLAAAWAGLYIVPRAIEFLGERPERVLVDFEPAEESVAL